MGPVWSCCWPLSGVGWGHWHAQTLLPCGKVTREARNVSARAGLSGTSSAPGEVGSSKWELTWSLFHCSLSTHWIQEHEVQESAGSSSCWESGTS